MRSFTVSVSGTHRKTDNFLLLYKNIKILFLKIVYELPNTFSLGQKQIANEKNAEKKLNYEHLALIRF